jgi:hypothetical protein
MSDDQQPRIVAEGRWSQDEFGDILYTPEHLRPVYPEPEPGEPGPWGAPEARSDGYRIRSDQTWALARRDYLAGETAETVCARYDLKEGTLRHRAKHEGWRRLDAADPDPVDLETETADGLPDLGDMARHALVRLDRAVRRGRAAEAASWLRTWRELTEPALAVSMLRLTDKAKPLPVSAPGPVEVAVDQDVRELAALTDDLMALSPGDAAGHAALDARLAALIARSGGGAISDDSDDSDAVFSAPGSESGPPRPRAP